MADDPLRELRVSDEVRDILAKIASETSDAYRESFQAMLQSLQDIAEGQKRLLTTLSVLVKAIEPRLGKELPQAIAIAMPGEQPDLATALVITNPEAAGYVLSQGDLAKRVGLSQPDASILVRAFRLDEDPHYAFKTSLGKKMVVKYREVAGARLRELIQAPPQPLTDVAQNCLRRVRKKLMAKTG